MNVLIIDDIQVIGNSIKIELNKNSIWNTITFFPYMVENSFEENLNTIVSIIIKNKVDVLCLDRGYSKIYEEDLNYIYSSIDEKHRALKIKGEEVLLGKSYYKGLLWHLHEKGINLKIILLYTYDKGNNEIDILLECLKETINEKLTQFSLKTDLYCFETSSIFNKPLNTILYPDSFYVSPTYRDQNIDYTLKKRNIGTKKAYIEYGQLIACIINDLVNNSIGTIYSFFNDSNIQYDFFLRSVNNLILTKREVRYEYYTNMDGNAQTQIVQDKYDYLKFNLSGVSALFKINDQEKYLVDIPFKEYYLELNERIMTKGLLALLKNEDGSYLNNQFVVYCYNFINNKEFHLYECHASSEIKERMEIIKAWLPILHSGAFHSKDAWQCEAIYDKLISEGDYRLTLLFYFDILDVFGYNGHINITFYHEGSNSFDINREIEAIVNNKVPLLKAKASEVLIPELKVEIVNQATRAAISQVMARNTSHNIGAHVMNKLIGDLSQIQLDKLNNYTNGIEIFNDKSDNNKNLLDQISIFNNYVKCRMDYLADISFGTPLMQTNKYAYGELFTELDKVRLLLEHISGLDDFKFEIKFTKNGQEFTKDGSGNVSDDLLVAIPNDILGTQAFYNILENVIRNSAKHSDKSKVEGNIVFTVNFIDDIKDVSNYCDEEKCDRTTCTKAHKQEIENALNEFIAVEVYDNIPVDSEKEATLKEEDIKEYKRMMGGKEPNISSDIDYLVFNQNKNLNKDILQENKLRSYSLGLVEMDASAAYLRKRPVEYINHPSYDIQYDESWSRDTELNGGKQDVRGSNCRHFLKAFKKAEGDKNYLGYRFFLHRPAVVLVVTELLKDDKDSKEKLRKEGIWVITPTVFTEELKSGKVYPHEFVVHSSLAEYKTKVNINDKEEEVGLLEHFKTSLPLRILEVNNAILAKILKEESDKLICDCWTSWEVQLKGKYQITRVDIGSSINPRFNGFQAVFLDHLYSSKTDTSVDYWEGNLAANHLEALSSIAQSKLPDFHDITKNLIQGGVTALDKFKFYVGQLNSISLINKKITESLFSKVVVIDERIQEAAETRNFMKIPYKCLYSKMNVRVPDKSINLSANSYTDDVKGDIERYIASQTEHAASTDFILIHYSIFERMYSKDKINENLKRLIASSPINVVFTSGRGTPDNLTENVRFINLSSVISAFVDIRCKYTINYLLNSTRKSKIS